LARLVRRVSRFAGAGAGAGACWAACRAVSSWAARAASSLGYMWLYVSRVMRVLACPRRRDTRVMGAPRPPG
jgi:hypothetical protein